MESIAVLTSGGDSPGMNAAIRAIVRVAASRGIAVLGVLHGYEGLMAGRFRALTRLVSVDGGEHLMPEPEVDLFGGLGGTVLGSARSRRFTTPEGRREAAGRIRDTRGLIVIGGNGSLAGAHALATEHGVPVVGVPASIDHDIGCTGSAIGVDTALNTIVDACDRVSDTARAHHRAFIVEVMGRQCGYLAMASAVACGADAVMYRERGDSEDATVEAVAQVIRKGFAPERAKTRVLIIKSEGVELPCTRLVRRLQELLATDLPDVEIRATVLGHVVRGGNPTFQDRMIGSRLGLAAVQALIDGASDEMVAWQPVVEGGTTTMDAAVRRFPLAQVLSETQALLDGTSALARWRVQMMQSVEGVLGL